MSAVPGPVARFTILFFTPLYLLLLAIILNRVNDAGMVPCVLAVAAGATAIVVVIIILSARFADESKHHARFSISSVMLLTTAIAVYFSYISQFTRRLPQTEINAYGVILFLFYCSFFIFITTGVLLRFADAVVALMVLITSFFRSPD